MQLTEIAFFTTDVTAQVDFYRRLLDLDPAVASTDMAIFMVGDTKLFIHRTYSPAPGDLPPENHTAFAVADLDAVCRALVARGLTLEVAPNDYYWGRSAYLRDPDGHLIELTQLSS